MMRRKEQYSEVTTLTITQEIRIRFNETDPLGIVWHGNYITYFEDGREAFGRKHGITYLDIHAQGYTVPIVKSSCEHKLPLKYGDVARVETTIVDTPAAKIIYRFKIYNGAGNLACTGETVQVFVNDEGMMVLNYPPFFEEWRKKVGLEK